MPKLGARQPYSVRFVWGSGRRGSRPCYTTNEVVHTIDALKIRAVVLKTSVSLTYVNRDTGESFTSTHDYTDRPPLRDEPGGDTDR